MKKELRVYVSGSTGLLGTSIVRELKKNNIFILDVGRIDLINLIELSKLKEALISNKVNTIIHCAGKVSGIKGNLDEDHAINELMGTNLIDLAKLVGGIYFINFSSTCVYALDHPQPYKSKDILNYSDLDKGNLSYALAKRNVISYLESSLENYISYIPCNLFGRNDNYKEGGHVIPELIKRFINNKDAENIQLYGTGAELRQFLFTDDISKVVVQGLLDEVPYSRLNLVSTKEYSIKEIALLIASLIGYKGTLEFISKYPGVFKKTAIQEVFIEETPIEESMSIAIRDYLSRYYN